LTLSDHQKTTPRQKALAKLATQGNHKFATGRRFKFRLPPLFSSRLSRHTSLSAVFQWRARGSISRSERAIAVVLDLVIQL
jgi:hypothetical protein